MGSLSQQFLGKYMHTKCMFVPCPLVYVSTCVHVCDRKINEKCLVSKAMFTTE